MPTTKMIETRGARYGRIAGRVIHVLIAAMIALAGAMKLADQIPPDKKAEMMPGIAHHLTLIGAGEVITAVLLVVPWTRSLGVLMASGFWGGVISVNMAQGHDFVGWSVMLLLTWVGAYLRDSRVLASFSETSTPP